MNKTLLILAAAATCALSPRVFAQDAPLPGTLFFQYSANSGKDHEQAPSRNMGGQITRLSPANGPKLVGLDCYGVTFDPNTNRMCFARGRDLVTVGGETNNHNVFYVCNLDGTDARLLHREKLDYSEYGNVPSDFMPCYTPDGHILFETGDRIARMNGDGGNVVFLTGKDERCGMPHQVGESIAFDKDGVCMMNLDGTGRTRMASFATHYGDEEEGDEYTDGQLSPDGKFIAFTRDKQVFSAQVGDPKSAWCISPKTGRLASLEFSDPVWSPDGRYLAMAGGDNESHDIFVLDMKRGKIRQITNTPDKDELPCDWDEVRE